MASRFLHVPRLPILVILLGREFVKFLIIYAGVQLVQVSHCNSSTWYLGERLISARDPLCQGVLLELLRGPFPVKGTPDTPVMGACYLINRFTWSSLNAASSCVPSVCGCCVIAYASIVPAKWNSCGSSLLWGTAFSAALRCAVAKLCAEPLF